MATSMQATQADKSEFVSRHLGPREDDIQQMLETLGYPTLDALIDATVPEEIRMKAPLAISAW